MKHFFAVIAIVLCFAAASRADEGKVLTDKGTGALLFDFGGLGNFGIGGLFNVGWPNGDSVYVPSHRDSISSKRIPSKLFAVPGVGVKYFIANNLAIKGGLGLGSVSTSTPNSNTNISANTESEFLLGIQAGVEWHMAGLGAVSPYLSGGIGFTTASISSKSYAAPETGTTPDEQDLSNSGTTFGINVGAGFEWFVTNNISLGAQYLLGFNSVSTNSEVKTTSTTAGASFDSKITNPSTTSIATNAFSVMLSIYP